MPGPKSSRRRDNPYFAAFNCLMRQAIGSILVLMAATSFAADSVGTGPSFKGPVGLQLYSLRGEFTRNVPATMEKVRDYGFKIVETAGTYNLSPQKFRELLDK